MRREIDHALLAGHGWLLVQHDRQVMSRLLEQVRPRFEAKTWEAFHRQMFDGQRATNFASSSASCKNLSVQALSFLSLMFDVHLEETAKMQVKLFWQNQPGRPTTGPLGTGKLTFQKAQGLEKQINDWLLENPGIKIVDIRQSASGGSFAESLWLISVWYEPTSHDNR